MQDEAVTEFFNQRKEDFLKKNIKSGMDTEEEKSIREQSENKFCLETWLPDAAKRAEQISISTHPCTFSHPSARKNNKDYASAVIAKNQRRDDGLLRSGNVEAQLDALGNAAALDVYKFLGLAMKADGQTLLTHIEKDTKLAKTLLTVKTASYEELKNGFLTMTRANNKSVTSSKIKQIYFPVENNYHLLSVLTPSGILFDLCKRLITLRFGEDTKQGRDAYRKKEYHEGGFREIYNLTTLGYGGTKPQNISALNNQNGGKVNLLYSAPPELSARTIHFPKKDFFAQSIRYRDSWQTFQNLHVLYQKDANNKDIRTLRDEYYLTVLDSIVERMWQVRAVADEQYQPEHHHLAKNQQIWLLGEYQQTRNTTDDWLDSIITRINQYIFHGYEKVIGKKALKLSDGEYEYIKKLLTKHQEVLR